MKKALVKTIGALAVAALSNISTFAQTTGFNQTAAGFYDYNNTANWVGGAINGIWDSSLTLAGTQTNTFAATPATATGLTFNYAGNFAVALQSADTTPQTFTLGGDISLNTSGGTTANVIIGNAANPLNVDLGSASRTFTVAGSRTLTIVNVISGAGFGITNAGAGTLVLSGTNTYSGGMTLNAGTLLLQANSTPATGTVTGGPLGTGTLTLNGGTFGFVGGAFTIANNVSVAGATSIEVASGQNEVLNGNWSGSGNLTLIANGNTGQWMFGGDNSGYTGTLTQNGGNTSLAFNSASAGSASAAWIFNNNVNQRTRLNVGSGTISFGSLSGNGSIANVSASGTATVSVGALNTSTTFSGVLGGSSAGQGQNINLLKVGSGTLTLSGANTYTGSTTISAGTLAVSGAGQLGGGYYSGSIINNASLTFSGTASQILAGPISGSGNLAMNGSSTLTLSGACAFTGNLTANSGTLTLACSQSFSPNTVGVNDGATLSESYISSVQMTASSVTVGLTTGATMAFVANSTSLARMTAGTLTLNGANTVNIIGGNLTAGSSYPLIAYTTLGGSGSLTLGTLPPGVAGNLSTVGNTIYFNVTGVTNTVWTGAVNGTWDINTTANWTNSGTLGNKYINGSPVQFDDTGLNTTTISNSVATVLSPISVLVTNNVNNYAFKANTIIAGAASLTKSGTANLTNSTPNTYTGPTVINQGQLVVGVASVANTSGALGNNSAVTLADDSTAMLNLNNFATQIGALSGGGLAGGNVALGNATLTLGGDNASATYAGVVSGTGGLTKIGTGTETLTGSNTFTGNWAVNGGTLNYNGSLASSGALTVNGSGANSIVNIGPGADIVIAGANHSMLIGNNAAGVGAVFQSGGSISTNLAGGNYEGIQVGSGSGAYGYYNLSGGSILVSELDCGGFNGQPTGVFDMTGGTMTVGTWFIVGRTGNGGGSSIFNMTGGTANIVTPFNAQFMMNWTANATQSAVINVANASLNATNATGGVLNMMRSGAAGEFAAVNLLSGGVMWVQGVNAANTTGTSHFNFNGGILKASTANANFITANVSAVNVCSGGGTIDNNGVNITIPKALTAPAGNGLNGSVTINSGGSGYIGAPAVTFSGGGGTGATAYATISGGSVTGVVITSPGINYSSTPTIVFTGGGGTGASATAPTPTANTSGGMTFLGSGTTTLTGASTYAGGTKVLGGTLVINTATGGAGGGGDLVVSNAALNVDASGGTALSGGNLTLQGTNVLTFAPVPSGANGSSTCINLSGALSNTGTNYVNVSGVGFTVGVYHLITAASGTVNTNNYILVGLPTGAKGILTNSTPTTLDFVITSIGQVLNWAGIDSSATLQTNWDVGVTVAWTPDGGNTFTTYNQYLTNTVGDLVIFGSQGANFSSTNYVNLVTNVVPASVTFNYTYPYSLTGSGSIGGATSLVITDGPAVYLGTSNSYTGGTYIYGGSLAVTNDNALGATSGGVTLGSDVVGNGTLQLNGVTSARNIAVVGNSSIGVAAGAASVLSGNINGTANLTKSDLGTLTLSGIVTNTGSLEFLTGTGAISGTVTIGGELWAGSSSDPNNSGVLNIQPGANVTVTSWIAIGRGNYGILNVNGGTLTKAGDNNSHISLGGTSTANQTSILNLNSGLIQDTTGDCWLGEQATAIVNQNGGIFADTGGSIYMGHPAGTNMAYSTYNLNGGLLQTRSIIGGFSASVSNATFNFNGGTLQAAASSSAFIQGLTAAYVTTNGAIIDTTNFTITVPQALADDPVSGPGALVKQGTGILTLSGSNTISGLITVNQGTLLETPADQGTNVVTVANGAAYGVQLTAGPGSVTNAVITLGSGSTTLSFALGTNGNPALPLLFCGALTNNGTVSVAVGANSSFLTLGSVIPLMHYTGGILGSVNPAIISPRGSSMTLSNDTTGHTLYAVVNGLTGGIVWTGTNSAPGLTNLWDLNSTTNWLISGSPTVYQETALPPGDAVLFNDLGSGTVLLSNTVNPTSVTISNSAVSYTFQGTGQINSLGGLTKVGSGTATLNLSGTYSVSTVVSNGTLNLGANQTFANLTGNGTISVPSGAATLTENSSANTTFSGILQGGLGLTKTGNSTLSLAGANTYTGVTSVGGGTLSVPTGGVISNTAGNFAVGTIAGTDAALSISGGSVSDSTTTGNAWASYLQVGNGANFRGAINLSAGSLNAQRHLILGNNGGYGAMTMSGGTLTVGSYFIQGFGTSGIGVFNQTGGAVTQNQASGAGSTLIGSGNGAIGVMNVSGGTFTATAGGIYLPENGTSTGILNISGAGAVTAGNVGVKFGNSANAISGTLNLLGGTLTANVLQNGGAGYSAVNFNGGTLKASGNNASFMTNLTVARIYSGGATIDDGGYAIGIGQALSAATGYGVASISVDTPGSGYLEAPVVTISGGAGANATAIAQVDTAAGTVTNILVTCPGSGYNNGDVLTVTLSGGGYTTAATVGSAVTFAPNTSGGLTKAGTGTLTLLSANTYTGNTVISNGTLLVNGSISSGATIINGGTLAGIGTIGGALTNNATLSPGTNGVGTLTVSGDITLNAGSSNTFNVNGSTLANNTVAAGGAVSYGGLLNIVPAGTFTLGQQFQLFTGAGAASASNFASIVGSPGSGLAFSFTNGVLSVVNGGPSGPGTITNSVSGNILALSWPSGQGWKLQMQTNSLSKGLSTNWVYITDGSISSTNITIDPAKPTVFYRLVYP